MLLIALAVVAVLGVGGVLYSAFSASDKPTASAPAGAKPADAAATAAFTARTLDGGQVTVPGNRPSVLPLGAVVSGGVDHAGQGGGGLMGDRPLIGEALCLHVPDLEEAIRGRLLLVDGTDVRPATVLVTRTTTPASGAVLG